MTHRQIKISKINYTDLDQMRQTEKGEVSFNKILTFLKEFFLKNGGKLN